MTRRIPDYQLVPDGLEALTRLWLSAGYRADTAAYQRCSE